MTKPSSIPFFLLQCLTSSRIHGLIFGISIQGWNYKEDRLTKKCDKILRENNTDHKKNSNNEGILC